MKDEISQALELCNKCGFCQAGCPVYKATGVEWMVARGRLALIKDALDGRLDLDEEMREPLFNCLTCNGCVDHCPSGVPTADVVNAARQELLRARGQPWVERLLFKNILPNGSLLSALTKTAYLGQSVGLAGLLQRVLASGNLAGAAGTGPLPVAPANRGARASGSIAKAIEFLPPLPFRSANAALKAVLAPPESPKHRIAYFAGCAASNVFPEVAVATARVLQHHQVQIAMPRFACCGKPAETYGDVEAARKMARANLDAVAKSDVDAIVTACATCSSFLKSYEKLLAGDEEYRQRAGEFVAKVRDVGEFLLEIGLDLRMGDLRQKVTWHDPCHLGRYQGLSAAPRQILKSIPSVDFVELPEANVCCGGAGLYSVTHHEVSIRILDRKMDNVARTGAKILATSCPSCTVQLRYGLRRRGLPVRAVELVQLLDQAYQAAEV